MHSQRFAKPAAGFRAKLRPATGRASWPRAASAGGASCFLKVGRIRLPLKYGSSASHSKSQDNSTGRARGRAGFTSWVESAGGRHQRAKTGKMDWYAARGRGCRNGMGPSCAPPVRRACSGRAGALALHEGGPAALPGARARTRDTSPGNRSGPGPTNSRSRLTRPVVVGRPVDFYLPVCPGGPGAALETLMRVEPSPGRRNLIFS